MLGSANLKASLIPSRRVQLQKFNGGRFQLNYGMYGLQRNSFAFTESPPQITSFTRQNSSFTACVASLCRMYREFGGMVEGVKEIVGRW
jgi:hypothetical protein